MHRRRLRQARQHQATGTAQSVLDFARPGARLVFSCGRHITRDGQDICLRSPRLQEEAAGWIRRLTRLLEIDEQIEGCRRIFASPTRWTVARGSDLDEGLCRSIRVSP